MTYNLQFMDSFYVSHVGLISGGAFYELEFARSLVLHILWCLITYFIFICQNAKWVQVHVDLSLISISKCTKYAKVVVTLRLTYQERSSFKQSLF